MARDEEPLLSRVHAEALATVGEVERRGLPTAGVLGLYAVLSLALFGLPVLGHLGGRAIASDPIDSSAFMWSFAWWPHALLHGLNPFVTHAIFVPEGFNLTWATAMPGPALLLSPITLAFGPVVTWNVIQLAAPALSAWTAFILCRCLTGRDGPSLVAGYVFGFSPYMLVHLTGGPHLALVALLPVFVWLVLRRLRDDIGPRAFVVWMGLALTGQYLISSEVLATATLFGAVALVLAYALVPDRRRELRDTARLLLAAYVGMAVLISPFLVFFFFGHHYPPGAVDFRADLAAYVLPSPLMAITRRSPAFAGSGIESYLGVPLVILLGAFAWRERRERTAWVPVLAMVFAGLCTLGSHVAVRGHRTSIPAPWLVLEKLPILRYAIPVRLALFVVLPAAVIVALFLRRGGWWRWGLALLAVAFILPNVGNAAWKTPIQDPPFFAHGAYKRYLASDDHVLTIPAWGPNERWQADTRFAFKLADGYAGNPFPPSYTRYPTWNTLLTGRLTGDSAAQLRRFVHDKGVTAVVVDETVPGPWRTLFGSLGVRPVSVGGVLLYRLRATHT
jgi:hypothetical protein